MSLRSNMNDTLTDKSPLLRTQSPTYCQVRLGLQNFSRKVYVIHPPKGGPRSILLCATTFLCLLWRCLDSKWAILVEQLVAKDTTRSRQGVDRRPWVLAHCQLYQLCIRSSQVHSPLCKLHGSDFQHLCESDCQPQARKHSSRKCQEKGVEKHNNQSNLAWQTTLHAFFPKKATLTCKN